MHWNLRMAAAQRGIWRASDLRRMLADAGLDMSHKKMLRLWSRQPVSVRLDNLDMLCRVLDCEPSELLVIDRTVDITDAAVERHPAGANRSAATAGGTGPRPLADAVPLTRRKNGAAGNRPAS